MIRPPGPVPRRLASDTPREAASARARGDAASGSPVACAAAAEPGMAETGALEGAEAAGAAGATGVAAAVGAAEAAGAGVTCAALAPCASAAMFSPGAPITAIGARTGTSLPASCRIAKSVPSAVDSTSNAALSVSTSQITSPRRTASPSFFFQPTMAHVSTDCPCLGMITTVAIDGFTIVLQNRKVKAERGVRGVRCAGTALREPCHIP